MFYTDLGEAPDGSNTVYHARRSACCSIEYGVSFTALGVDDLYCTSGSRPYSVPNTQTAVFPVLQV
jgi:hypothetical protein